MNVNQGYYNKKRKADGQYKRVLREIINNGVLHETVQLVDAQTLLVPKAPRYDLRNGIPLITERDMSIKPKNKPNLWQQAIAEILAFINGARTLVELERYGCHWWSQGNLVGARKCKRFIAISIVRKSKN